MDNNSLEKLSNLYITSGGRIWGVKTDGSDQSERADAQARRDSLGNNFNSLSEAALARARLKVWAKVKPYVKKSYILEDDTPIIKLSFDFPATEKENLISNLEILINDNYEVDYLDPVLDSIEDDEIESSDIKYSDIEDF